MNKKNVGVFILLCLLLFACGGKKKKSISGADEVNVNDIWGAYPVVSLPFTYGDSSFPVKENDSLLITPEVFQQLVPDSVITAIVKDKNNIKYYPAGAINNKDEYYLLTRAITTDKKILLISSYDKNKKFIAALPVIKIDKKNGAHVTVTIDPRLNINKDISQKLSNDIEITGHDVYILNQSSRKFMLIMTDSLGDGFTELINPIDTIPKRHKYTGDYGGDKMNLISIRDGQREGRSRFFIHLEKNNKECVGELKGEIVFTSENVAEYRQGGDQCILRFVFTNNAVKLEEVEGCGSRLGALQCSFNGNYAKKKLPKTITSAKNKKNKT